MAETRQDEIAKLEALYAGNPAGRVFTHLAEAYRKAGELARAREILAGGLELHPEYASAHVVLGRVLVDLGEREEAAGAFRRVLELDRHNLVALRGLGDLAVESGRFEEARHYFGELMQLDPGDTETAGRLNALPEAAPAAVEEEPGETAWGGAEAAEPEAEREAEGAEAGAPAGAEPVEATGESEERPEGEPVETVAVPDVEFAALDGEPGSFGGEATPEEAGPPEAGAEGGYAAATLRQPSPLDAWVESLSVLAPEPTLPAYPVPTAGEPEAPQEAEAAGPDLGAVAEPEAGAAPPEAEADAGPAVELEGASERAEGEALAEAILEAEAEALYPAPELEAEEPSDWVAGIEIEGEAGPGDVAGERSAAEPAASAPIEVQEGPEASFEGPVETAPAGELESAWWGDPGIHGTVPDPVEWVSQEDWERIAAYGAWSGTADVEGTEEAAPEPASEWGESGPDEDADEVATETLAEVYAAQGFRTEAAEIYRKLLRRRPDDPRLRSRLAALEAERAGPMEGAGYEAGGESGLGGEEWLEHVETAWSSPEDLVVAGPTPYAWVEAAGTPEAEEGETIGHCLRGLLAWRPESVPEPTLLLEDVAVEPPQPGFPDSAPPRGAPAAGIPGDGEDDLEMFRSWLKSLRT